MTLSDKLANMPKTRQGETIEAEPSPHPSHLPLPNPMQMNVFQRGRSPPRCRTCTGIRRSQRYPLHVGYLFAHKQCHQLERTCKRLYPPSRYRSITAQHSTALKSILPTIWVGNATPPTTSRTATASIGATKRAIHTEQNSNQNSRKLLFWKYTGAVKSAALPMRSLFPNGA